MVAFPKSYCPTNKRVMINCVCVDKVLYTNCETNSCECIDYQFVRNVNSVAKRYSGKDLSGRSSFHFFIGVSVKITSWCDHLKSVPCSRFTLKLLLQSHTQVQSYSGKYSSGRNRFHLCMDVAGKTIYWCNHLKCIHCILTCKSSNCNYSFTPLQVVNGKPRYCFLYPFYKPTWFHFLHIHMYGLLRISISQNHVFFGKATVWSMQSTGHCIDTQFCMFNL